MLLAVLALGGLFNDHMVLQRGRANALWGSDQPRQVITLTVDGAKNIIAPVQATTGADGKWPLACSELPVGGPYRLHLKGTAERVIEDVLVGDVWLASGQSNMEFPLSRASHADHEIAAAQWPAIRFAKIPQTVAQTPQSDIPTAWQVTSPASAGSFTAVGYFFARELHERTGVPIGIIDSTWGGTRVEAWTSLEALRPVMPEVDNLLARIAAANPQLPRIRAEYDAKVAVWMKQNFPQDTGNAGEPLGWARPDCDDHSWRTMSLPNSWQSQGSLFNGAAWFRRTLELPAATAGHDLTLNLGAVDDFDTTYFNGEQVGAIGPETAGSYQVQRHYIVPGRLVHAGVNVIAVRVFDNFGDGGLTGPAIGMFAECDGSHLSLDGP